MSKILVLAEKPSVGKDIARVLGCDKSKNGYAEGNKYIVTWALGHLVTLSDPERYNQKYKIWEMEDLPILPETMKTDIIKQSSKQFNVVKSLLNRDDVDEVVIATDAGREGELVARWIIEKSNVRKKIKRLWISSVTDKAIKDGFNNLKDGRLYENLYKSAKARAEADWIVGINATRALTCRYNAQLSCGRVQTPTIAIIAAHEDAIRDFKPQEYYGIEAMAGRLKFNYLDSKSKQTTSFNEEKIDNILNSIKGKELIISDVKKTKEKTYSPALYDLTELQRDANKMYGYSAKETLNIMQKLYEHHKVLTYPRTDSRYISSDIVETLRDRIKACSVGSFSKYGARILKSGIKANKSLVDDKKVSDHHAIIPTEQTVFIQDFTDRERKIYELVVKRFLAVLSEPFEYEKITVNAKINNEEFISRAKSVISQGWKEIYNNLDDTELMDINSDISSKLVKGSKLSVSSIKKTVGKTNPPERFTEATLLSAMENPKKYMKNLDKDLAKTLGETGGLGTVATRADIIDKLFNSFMIEKKDKYIYTTSKGRQILDLVPKDLKSPELTGVWEQKLSDIGAGKLKADSFITEMREYTKSIVSEIKSSDHKYVHDNQTREKCPDCGNYLLEVNGKKGKMLVCQNRECGYRKGVSQITNARCPNCHKKLELRGEGEGKLFVCKCGYREKLSAFNKRKKEETTKISNKDARKFLEKQKKSEEQNLNTALADALAKLKL